MPGRVNLLHAAACFNWTALCRANQSEAAREREDAAARYHERVMREREERRRAQEQERQPGRSIADDWLDEMLNKKDGPR